MQTAPTVMAGAVCSMIYIVYCQKSSCSQFCGNPMAFLSTVGYALNKSISLSLNEFLGDMENSRYLIMQIL